MTTGVRCICTVLKFQNLKRAKIYIIWSLLCIRRQLRTSDHIAMPSRSTCDAFDLNVYRHANHDLSNLHYSRKLRVRSRKNPFDSSRGRLLPVYITSVVAATTKSVERHLNLHE
jgi:hypothetical protein